MKKKSTKAEISSSEKFELRSCGKILQLLNKQHKALIEQDSDKLISVAGQLEYSLSEFKSSFFEASGHKNLRKNPSNQLIFAAKKIRKKVRKNNIMTQGLYRINKHVIEQLIPNKSVETYNKSGKKNKTANSLSY